MRVVAITELNGDLDQEAAAIAALLGVSAYDARSRVSGTLPRVVMQTPDAALAASVQRGLVARGHGAVECEIGAAVSSARMVKLHRFTLDAEGVWANDGAGERLAWSNLGVVVVALVRADVTRTTEEEEFVRHGGRATPIKVTHERTKTEHAFAHAAYFFPRRNSASRRPWLLGEASAQFVSLGPRMQPTRRANFFATLAAVRQLAPDAVFDDRFVTHPQTSSVALQVHGADAVPAVSTGATLDVTVHILAAWLQRDRSGPYR